MRVADREVDVAALIGNLFEVLQRSPRARTAGAAADASTRDRRRHARDLDPTLDPIEAVRPYVLKPGYGRLADPRFLARDWIRAAAPLRNRDDVAGRSARHRTRSAPRRTGASRTRHEGLDTLLREQARSANRSLLALLVAATHARLGDPRRERNGTAARSAAGDRLAGNRRPRTRGLGLLGAGLRSAALGAVLAGDAARRTLSASPAVSRLPRYGEAGIAPAARAVLDAIARQSGLGAAIVIEGTPLGYRHRARLMVRGRAGSPKLGIFQAGTHDVVDIPRCRVHHPLVNEVGAALREAIRATGTRPYAERSHTGALRAVQIVVERASQTAQLVLVGNAATPEPLAAAGGCPRRRTRRAPAQPLVERQPVRTNTILVPIAASSRTRCGARVGAWGGRLLSAGCVRTKSPGAGRRTGARASTPRCRMARAWPSTTPAAARSGSDSCAARRAWCSSRARPTPCVASRWASRRGPSREQLRAAVVAGSAGEALEARDGAHVVIVDPPRPRPDAPLARGSPPSRRRC